MKNFEIPKINIDLFAIENIITASGTGTETDKTAGKIGVAQLMNKGYADTSIAKFKILL